MKYDACIAGVRKLAGDDINLNKTLDELEADIEAYRQKVVRDGTADGEAAKDIAAEMALQEMLIKKKRDKRQAALQAIRMRENMEILDGHVRGREAGLMSRLTRDLQHHAGKTAYSNVDYRAKAIEGQAHSRFKDGLAALHTRMGGLLSNDALAAKVVKELFGEATGDADAAKAAKGFADAAEFLRTRSNRAGSNIGKLDDWGLPQSHSASRLRKVDAETWAEDIKPLLDREKMTDDFGVPLTDADLDLALQNAYQNIITNGSSKMKLGQMGKGKLANRHQDSRFLIFKDSNAWLEYQGNYGEPDVFSTMTNHIRHMSNEIAMMEILGPNPDYAFKYLRDYAGVQDKKFLSLLDATYNVVSGKADALQEGIVAEKIAQTTGFTRYGLVAAQLGAAFISSIGDVIFGKATRGFNGMPATKMIQSVAGQLNPASEADRKWAAHMGLVMDSWTGRAIASARHGVESDSVFSGSKLSSGAQKASEFVMRASGLQQWTAANRNAFGLEFQWWVAENVGQKLADIEPKFQATLRRYGVTDEAWEVIRKADLEDHGGNKYFRPDNIRDIEGVTDQEADQLSSIMLEAMNSEIDFASPMPSARERAMMTGGLKRGSIMGEAARAFTMYKGFSLTVFNTHVMRGITPDHLGKRNLWYLSKLFVSLTVTGALALQLKEISKGRDPKDMDSAEFWAAAAAQGGGMGILGDFFYTGVSGQSRTGQNLATTLAGPQVGFYVDTLNLAFSPTGKTMSGKDTNFGRQATKYFKQYTPASSLWYTRLITERMIFDQIQKEVDPKSQKTWAKQRKRALKDSGQKYWWEQGKTAPKKAPQF